MMEKVNSVPMFRPPGHFYSPIVDPAKAEAHLKRKAASPVPERVAGIELDLAEMRQTWEELVPALVSCPFRDEKVEGLRYNFKNSNYSNADAILLHAMIRQVQPKAIIEIGSGWSSACTLDTVESYLNGNCQTVFIEPYPQLLNSMLKGSEKQIHVVRRDVQDVPLELFEALEPNDILFIDSTHVAATGSDVCFELFEILPRLRPGVVVHIHDIFWPFEYPYEWAVVENRSWNELYAIRAFLTNNREWKILFFSDYFATFERKLIEATCPLFRQHAGAALWLVKQ